MSEKNFFLESAFGDIYEGTFFAEDFPQCPNKNAEKNTSPEDAQLSAATSKVRLPTEVEVNRQVTEKINSMYALGGNFGSNSLTPTFNGNIIGI